MNKNNSPADKELKTFYALLAAVFFALFVLFALLGGFFSTLFFIGVLPFLAGAFYCFFHFLSICKRKNAVASKTTAPKSAGDRKPVPSKEMESIFAEIESKFPDLPLDDWKCDEELYETLNEEAKKGKPSVKTLQAVLMEMEKHIGLSNNKSIIILEEFDEQRSGKIDKGLSVLNEITVYCNDAFRADNYLCILAHEVSHAFQYSRRVPASIFNVKPDFSEEKLTDVLAFFLGFGLYAEKGKHAETVCLRSGGKSHNSGGKFATQMMTIGYLDDAEIELAKIGVKAAKQEKKTSESATLHPLKEACSTVGEKRAAADDDDDGVCDVVERFDDAVKEAFTLCVAMAMKECASITSVEHLAPLSLALASFAFDCVIYDYTFMRKPAWPYTTVFSVGIFAGFDPNLADLEGYHLYDELVTYKEDKQIFVVNENDFARIVCKGTQGRYPSLIADPSRASEVLRGLFLEMRARYKNVKNSFTNSRRLLNLYLAEGIGIYGKTQNIASRLYYDILDECPEIALPELRKLTHDCIENFCDLIIKDADFVNAGILVPALEELVQGLFDEAEKSLETYNSAPMNAGTSYGEWVYCMARLDSVQNPDLMNEREKDRAKKRVMLDVFKNNEIMFRLLSDTMDRNDFEIDTAETIYIYFNYLYSHKKEYGLTDTEIRIVSMLMCCNAMLEEKENRDGDARYEDFFMLATMLVILDHEKPYDFGSFIAKKDMSTLQTFIYGASISAIAALNYAVDGDASLEKIMSRQLEIYSHIHSLLKGDKRIPREEEEVRKIESMPASKRNESILYFKATAATFLENLKKMIDQA